MAIDEKKLIKAINEIHYYISGIRSGKTILGKWLERYKNDVIRTIEIQPKVGEWIPIGQYPSEPSLLCFENGEMSVGYYDYDFEEWHFQCTGEDLTYYVSLYDEPIAYMSLPEPYKGE